MLVGALHPDFNLIAVTTVAGNCPVDVTTLNTLKVLESAAISGVPVYRGADGPLVGPPIDRSAGWPQALDLPEPSISAEPVHAVDFLVETLTRGHHSTALAGAAKLYETGFVPAICEELEEYAHEQMFVLEPGDPVLVVTSRGASQRRAVEIADGVSDLRGDPVIVLELEASDVGGHRVLPVAPLAEPVEEVAALTHLMPLQL